MPHRKPSRQTINIIIAVLTVIIVAAAVLSRDRSEQYSSTQRPASILRQTIVENLP